jgi:DNA-directed RNA polymerase subunit M/transcription elongation factor TFIIS
MEFCPKCGTILVPEKVGRSRRLVCSKCGYKGKLKKPSAYKISEKGEERKEVPVIIEKKKKKKKPMEREYEVEQPEYVEEEGGESFEGG